MKLNLKICVTIEETLFLYRENVLSFYVESIYLKTYLKIQIKFEQFKNILKNTNKMQPIAYIFLDRMISKKSVLNFFGSINFTRFNAVYPILHQF